MPPVRPRTCKITQLDDRVAERKILIHIGCAEVHRHHPCLQRLHRGCGTTTPHAYLPHLCAELHNRRTNLIQARRDVMVLDGVLKRKVELVRRHACEHVLVPQIEVHPHERLFGDVVQAARIG